MRNLNLKSLLSLSAILIVPSLVGACESKPTGESASEAETVDEQQTESDDETDKSADREQVEADDSLQVGLADLTDEKVTVVGTNTCLGCKLKGEHEAKAQCSDFGHTHVLQIDYAENADGDELAGLAGKSIHYLPNDQSADLVEGDEFHDERVQVEGRLLGAAATLEVADFGPPSDDLAESAEQEDEFDSTVTEAVLVGQSKCLGCSLKGEHGAKAQCSDFGHTHALQVRQARTADGDKLEKFVGRTVHFLANDASAPLLEGDEFHNAEVKVEGRLFEQASTVEVHNFEAPDEG